MWPRLQAFINKSYYVVTQLNVYHQEIVKNQIRAMESRSQPKAILLTALCQYLVSHPSLYEKIYVAINFGQILFFFFKLLLKNVFQFCSKIPSYLQNKSAILDKFILN